MKRSFIYLILGLGVVYSLFVSGVRTSFQLTKQAQQNISKLSMVARKATHQFKSWWIEDTNEAVTTSALHFPLTEEGAFVDYEAALNIVYEIIEDLEQLFTDDQRQAIETRISDWYKQTILKEYQSQIGPSYYE